MITKQQKIILFRKFGLSESDIICDLTITYIHKRLNAELWKTYLDELRNIMLNRMDRYEHLITKFSMADATAYLLLMATPEDKFEALSKSLNLWDF